MFGPTVTARQWHRSAGQVLPGGLKSQPSALSQKHVQSPAAQIGWHDGASFLLSFEVEQ